MTLVVNVKHTVILSAHYSKLRKGLFYYYNLLLSDKSWKDLHFQMFVLSTENLLHQNDVDFSSSYFGSAFRFFICVVAILGKESGVYLLVSVFQ